QKKAKEHKEMLGKLEKGDNIITNSGIYGRVVSTADDTVTVEIADNVRVKMAKDAVAVRKPQG
ncbi:MAG: preprotein translocase subunit YajC, partial [Deltaproteobacteria bacterium]